MATPTTPTLQNPGTHAGWAPLDTDPMEQMAADDRDDWTLLRLVVCVAVATLATAIATTLPM